jgi:hypothetical protein
MSTTFEQSRQLNVVVYKRLLRDLEPVSLAAGVIISGILFVGLWREAEAGKQVAAWCWAASAGIGVLVAGQLRLLLLVNKSSRRYMEFQGDRLFLTRRRPVALRRVISWSLVPDPIEPRYTVLRLTYRFGRGRKHWTMLMDNDAQISELRHALTLRIPQSIAR